MTVDMQWEDPPARPKPPGRSGWYAEFFDALRANPGRWAVWPVESKYATVTTRIKQGAYSGIVAGEFDAVLRTQPDGTRKFWVRYIGDES